VSHLVLVLSLLTSTGDEAPQWGGFRGNNGAGTCSATKLPAALDPETNLQWRVEVPDGYSSPVIAGGHLVVTGVDGKAEGGLVSGALVTLCLDAYTGEERWRHGHEFSGARPGGNSSAAPSPATDGEVVVSLFHHVGLLAFDMTGKELWKQEIGPFNIPHGMATSPLIHGDLVLLQVDQDRGAYLVAYDKKTGAERWKVERPGVSHSYATPAVWTPPGGGGPAQLVVSGSFQIAGYELTKGEKLWWMDGSAWQSKSIPVFADDRCIVNAFMPSLSEMKFPRFSGTFAETLAAKDADEDGKIGKDEYGDETLHQLWFIFDQDGDEVLDADEWDYALASNQATGGLYALELGGKGDVTKSHLKWKSEDRRTLSDVTSPVVVGDTLFIVADGSMLTALDVATGEVVKQERVGQPAGYYASPVAGDGKLYLASHDGLLTVVTAERDFQELATHSLDEEQVWATPAIAGRAVYVRSTGALYCFEDPE
jgi:outer membrane protein assembly factor BamB